jgi:hypothetical protein
LYFEVQTILLLKILHKAKFFLIMLFSLSMKLSNIPAAITAAVHLFVFSI